MPKGIQLIGDKELQRIFKKLPEKARGRAVKSIARAAARPLIKEARRIAPKDSGTTRRNIKTSTMRSRSKDYTGVWAGIRPGRTDAFYAFHNVNPKTNRSNRGRINQPHDDYMQEAAENVGDQVTQEMEKKIIQVLRREIKKL
jgi:HK97 gp10 family phage protein